MQLKSECRSLDISARGPTTKAFTLPYSLILLAMGPSRGLLRSCPLYSMSALLAFLKYSELTVPALFPMPEHLSLSTGNTIPR